MQNPKSKKSTSKVSDCRNKIEGKYANYFKVGYNAFEFVFDFGQNYTENDQAEPCARIITSPVYVRALLETLRESLEQYEKDFGSIQE
jgi:hypothetical protein